MYWHEIIKLIILLSQRKWICLFDQILNYTAQKIKGAQIKSDLDKQII